MTLEEVMLDHFSLMTYHYVTPKVGNLPPGLNRGGNWPGVGVWLGAGV